MVAVMAPLPSPPEPVPAFDDLAPVPATDAAADEAQLTLFQA